METWWSGRRIGGRRFACFRKLSRAANRRSRLGWRSTASKAINSCTWHAHERSPQVFRLYGADGAAANFIADPKFGVDPGKVGWKLIADVDTRPAPWPRGITGISIHQKDPAKNLGAFRYLLFAAFPTETHDAQGHTFFSEIDVISAN